MIQITFPDGNIRSYAAGTTGLEIAKSISEGLARNVLAVGVNGEVRDLTRPIHEDAAVMFYKWEDKEGNTRYTTEVKVRDLTMLGGVEKKSQPVAVAVGEGEDDLPF